MFNVPEHGSPKINVMLDQSHTAVSGPAPLIVISNNVVIGGIRVCRQIPLDEIARLVGSESEKNLEAINISRIQPDRMASFCSRIPVLQKVVWHLGWSSHLTGSLKAKNEQVKNKTIVLKHESRKLETTNEAEGIDVRHILVSERGVILGSDVIRKIVVKNESEQAIEKGKIDFFVNFGEDSFHHYNAFSFACIPDVSQIVDTLAPLNNVKIILIQQ